MQKYFTTELTTAEVCRMRVRPTADGRVVEVDDDAEPSWLTFALVVALMLATFAFPLSAFPPASAFVADSADGQFVEVVRAAYVSVHGDDDDFAEGHASAFPMNDRFDVRHALGTREQRRRLVETILADRRFARAVLGAHYDG